MNISTDSFDESRALLANRPVFVPFVVDEPFIPIAEANLPEDYQLLLVERFAQPLALSVQ